MFLRFFIFETFVLTNRGFAKTISFLKADTDGRTIDLTPFVATISFSIGLVYSRGAFGLEIPFKKMSQIFRTSPLGLFLVYFWFLILMDASLKLNVSLNNFLKQFNQINHFFWKIRYVLLHSFYALQIIYHS